MNAPADIRPAATVVLLRDGAHGVEVFLMRRHGASGFMAGATVFPGGKVDVDDRLATAWGQQRQTCARQLGLEDEDEARAFFVAAVRELHEESHVLLAASHPGGPAPDAEVVAAIDRAQDALRTAHRLAARDWHDTVRGAGLRPDLDTVAPFAHWLTPRAEPRRFDTYFFAATCPPHQQAALDRHESTAAFWLTPAQALDRHAQGGDILLPPPTLHTLARLAALAGPAQAVVQQLAAAGVGPCIEPWFVANSPDGPAIVMPEDPLHPEGEIWRTQQGVPAREHRFVLQDGRFTHKRA